MEWRDHIRRAIEIAGSQHKLAERAGCSQNAISKLLHQAERVSAEMAAMIDRATDGQVPKHVLRPDVFDPPPVSEHAA